MSTPLRAVRTAQSFTPTAPKVAVRNLHITGAQAQPSTALAFQTRVAELRKGGERPQARDSTRPFNTTRALQRPHDTSPIDMAYMPSMPSEPLPSDFGLIPILPDTAPTTRAKDPLLVSTDEVVKAEISTMAVLAEGKVQALSESEGGKAADKLGLVEEVEKVKGGVKRVWEGFVDDLLGEKRVAV